MPFFQPVPGETPLTDVSELKIKGILYRSQLNKVESTNITKQLAARERLPVAEKSLRLLQEAVAQKTQANDAHVQEILERLIRNRFRADPTGPDVVQMLREDRNR